MASSAALELVTLTWVADELGTQRYVLTGVQTDGQLRMLGDFERGPFDTALEVAQWAWRVICRAVPPTAG